ncbi:MAG: F0F1 ATP synthase subunit A [Arachidicoccus sp.]|nr:F0F1 ATP synthase subunit A [Arachidicoccus sp.]
MASKFAKLLPILTFSLFLSLFSFPANAAEKGENEGKLNISHEIFGHIEDAYEWHFFSVGDFEASIPLPVILYSPSKGLSAFSAAKFHHGEEAYNGYKINEKGKIEAIDGSKFYDFSLTKNVVAMFIAVIILLVVFIRVGKTYTKNGSDKAPSGFQNAVEACVVFVRDEVAKPNLGDAYKKYMPFLLSLFFFIWLGNLLGLIPGGANLTGNIAFTCCLAAVSFLVMLFTSKKDFWSHLFNPPGMPFFVKVVLVPIELISLIIKPIALTIRLFANMLAGHIVVVCFILLIFIFAGLNKFVGIGFAPISIGLSVFSTLIEVLVTAIQAYIFANLVSVFIGQMIEDHHSHDGMDHVHSANEISA